MGAELAQTERGGGEGGAEGGEARLGPGGRADGGGGGEEQVADFYSGLFGGRIFFHIRYEDASVLSDDLHNLWQEGDSERKDGGVSVETRKWEKGKGFGGKCSCVGQREFLQG